VLAGEWIARIAARRAANHAGAANRAGAYDAAGGAVRAAPCGRRRAGGDGAGAAVRAVTERPGWALRHPRGGMMRASLQWSPATWTRACWLEPDFLTALTATT
jgi:hypothetical protein